jgi:arabinogalactan oligomer/maltooligosaccharide transport system permease protein
VKGHLSSFLLIKGLISTFLLFYFIIFFIWSIRDAYKTSVEYEKTHKFVKDTVYFKNLYEHAFEYIVLSPAIFIVTFISLMPIVFGFIIAFTTYNGNAADVGLFEWAKYGGFENFLKIFSFGENVGLDFGHSFWRVFLWTVIWAIFSTVTVFFGGFFQAIVINSERVPLRKFWRTLLILPWAVPALISQMVLANFFNELGVVNEFLKNIGVEQILTNWGFIGRTWAQFKESGLPTILFLGEDHIQWVSNAHNVWFVRTMLIVINIWLGFPYYMALMSSVMAGIDKTLFEAADIDGANRTQKFRFITFPLVLFSTAPLLVMCFSGNFNNFGVIYFITQGGANKGYSSAFAGDTDILISWMYTLTVEEKYYNVASVFSIMIFFIVGSIAAWNYARTKSFQED